MAFRPCFIQIDRATLQSRLTSPHGMRRRLILQQRRSNKDLGRHTDAEGREFEQLWHTHEVVVAARLDHRALREVEVGLP